MKRKGRKKIQTEKGGRGGAWKCSKKEKKRKEIKERKGEEEKRKERRKKGKERKRGTETNVAQEAEPDDKGPGTALREVGFLILWLFYA